MGKREKKPRGAKARLAKASQAADTKLEKKLEEAKISARNTTGVLASHPTSRDLQIMTFALSFHGKQLVEDTQLDMNYGRRYGLLGLNGCGKSTLLRSIAERDIEIPSHIDIFLLQGEAEATDDSALDFVLSVDEERVKLEAQAEELLKSEEGADSDTLQGIYERLDELDVDQSRTRAAEILHGLGFTPEMQEKKTREFSGGWRMRIALARALFLRPHLLLLDEPTNHLDLEACVWLEEYLKGYNRILVLVSHSQDFLNAVCTNIIHMHKRRLDYYSGNYDAYVKARREKEEHQMKRYNWEQEQIRNMKEYIARFGHGSAKLARQAQSKEKTLEKMIRAGLTEKVEQERLFKIKFAECGKLPPPVLQFQQVSFGYNCTDTSPPEDLLYHKLDLGADLDSRIALVGPNGAGKSTLLKLMAGELIPTDGMVRRHHHLRIARYHQHLNDQLDVTMTPIEFMAHEFPEELKEEDKQRAAVGRFGLTKESQTSQIDNLSDGQKSRVVFAWLAMRNPHMLLLDEPTNHLDIETIDLLAEAINEFEGGVIVVSHDFRLIDQIAKEIWVCEGGKVTPWDGDIQDYKHHLRQQMGLA